MAKVTEYKGFKIRETDKGLLNYFGRFIVTQGTFIILTAQTLESAKRQIDGFNF